MMAYYPSELSMLAPALMVDEELDDMVQVQLSQEGESEINLYSRFSTELGSGLSKSGHHQQNQNYHHHGLSGQNYNQEEGDMTFESYMSRQTRPIPMPMPGLNDPSQSEPDYLDTPYQLKTLGQSLSSYTEYNEGDPYSSSLVSPEDLIGNHNHHHHHHPINMSHSPNSGSMLNENGPTLLNNANASSATIGLGTSNNNSATIGGINSSSANSVSNSDLIEGGDVEVKQSDSSESQAYYGSENVVRELRMEYVRWFYKTESDKLWTPFTGYDSMRIEARYRELVLCEEEDLASPQEQELYAKTGVETEFTFDSPERRLNTTNAKNMTTNNNNNTSGSSSRSRTNRVYRSFTRKWLEWSGPNQGVGANSSPKNEGANNNNATNNNGSNNSNTNNASGTATGGSQSSSQQQQQSTNKGQWPPIPPPNNPDNIIIVRGGLYEVDLEHNICYATYWPDMCSVCRGTWFYDGSWQPIESQHADKLEIEHLEKFGGASLVTPSETLPESPTKKTKQVAHRVSFTDFHVDWTSATEIHLYSKAVSHKLMRHVSARLGFQAGGHRICRGYFKQCMLSDRPAEINHVCFVVHGIGQKMDTGRIVRNCAAFRDCVATLKKQLYPQSEICRQRAEFFPVEWRSAAKLDGDIVDAITPHKLLGLRQMLNATAMDIMYYTSPLYRTEIQNALRSELNRIYSNFVKRNPNFEARGGKVSVLAHSLGVVITYDIMTGYISPLRSDCPELRSIELNGVDTNEEINHEGILVIDDVTSDSMPEQPRLLFKLEHFFCLGSPLAVFLALRWKEPHNPDLRSYILPPTLCKRIYNVFHPSDPVAYRLEPLLNKFYMKIAPLLIHSTGTSPKTKYDEMEKELINRDLPTQPTRPETATTVPTTMNSSQQQQQQDYNYTTMPNPRLFNQPHNQNTNSFRNLSLNSTPQKCSGVPMSSSLNNSASGGMGNSTQGSFSVFNSTNSNGPRSPSTPSKDSNWSWFNLMKYWKSPENQTDFGDVSGMEPSEFNNEHQQQSGLGLRSEVNSPEELNYLNSPPSGSNSQNGAECRKEAVDDIIPNVPNDLEYRMDYVLRESNLSSSYLAALTSHTSYWSCPDVAFFVLMHLYNGVLESVPE